MTEYRPRTIADYRELRDYCAELQARENPREPEGWEYWSVWRDHDGNYHQFELGMDVQVDDGWKLVGMVDADGYAGYSGFWMLADNGRVAYFPEADPGDPSTILSSLEIYGPLSGTDWRALAQELVNGGPVAPSH